MRAIERLRELRERRRRRRMLGHRLLRAFADSYPEARFLEIGAGDGVSADHLRPFIVSRPWRGVMVEPVPYVFERLRRNCAGLDRVTLENVAIADHDGELPFYHFAEATGEEARQVPGQYHLLGSLSREMLMRHEIVPDRERRIVRTVVPCRTVESLSRKHGVERFDLIVVDAEGQDCRIVEQIDLERRGPRLLVYEDAHVPADERDACLRRLHRLGYETVVEFLDTWCLDIRPDDALTRSWRRLRRKIPTWTREEINEWLAAAAKEK